MGRQDFETETLIAHALSGNGFDASEDGTGRGTPLATTTITHLCMFRFWDFRSWAKTLPPLANRTPSRKRPKSCTPMMTSTS
jgi:hypothetical protein